MFSLAQLFHIDSDSVQYSSVASISKIDLFFYAKPSIDGNRSGIYAPGVEINIAPTQSNVPYLDYLLTPTQQISQPVIARKEYSEINTSTDASRATTFIFPTPVKIDTNKEYAIIIKYDGSEEFTIWFNRIGENLVNLGYPSGGPSGKGSGKLFHYLNSQSPIAANTNTSNTTYNQSSQNTPLFQNPSSEYLMNNWKPVSDTILKFNVYVARYAHNGVPLVANTTYQANALTGSNNLSTSITVLSNNLIRYTCPAFPQEYISYNKKTSNTDNLKFGDIFFQKQPYFPGSKATPATVSVSNTTGSVYANTSYVLSNGANFNFSQVFNNDTVYDEYITVISLNHYGANQHAIDVKKIRSTSNTFLIVTEPFTFNNSAAYFYKSPVGRIVSKDRTFLNGEFLDFVILSDSNANATCRFVNNCIDTATIAAGGNGYSNSDYVTIAGYENVTAELEGGYVAVANLQTNSTGGIINLYFSNVGCGFNNVAAITYTVSNTSGANSAGTGANITFTTDTVIYNEFGNLASYLKGAQIVNFEATQLYPDVKLHNPVGTVYNMKFKSQYYKTSSANTSTGYAYYLNPNATLMDVKSLKIQNFIGANSPVIVSRSNQYSIRYANGGVANSSVVGKTFSNNVILFFDASSNNDYVSIELNTEKLDSYYAKFTINNDYTNEHTNYGNAYSKQISTKLNFNDGRFAEDILVYMTAYRPVGTDFKVYARIHNSNDEEAFDDKDWSLLEQIDGIGVYSTNTDSLDMKEYTYGFTQYPNSQFTCSGTVKVNLNEANVAGSNTTFSSNLAVLDLVKIYSPLFPNNYSVAVVNSVVNNTLLTLKNPISNSSLVGSGLKIDKLQFSHQAFNNMPNQNVVRYYSTSMVEYDTYNTFQIKVIFLTNDEHIIPKIDDIEAVGVTA